MSRVLINLQGAPHLLPTLAHLGQPSDSCKSFCSSNLHKEGIFKDIRPKPSHATRHSFDAVSVADVAMFATAMSSLVRISKVGPARHERGMSWRLINEEKEGDKVCLK